jgi:RNA polymerase sigma-70 factor (ECF subfamily)
MESAKGWLVGILRHCYAQMRRKHRFSSVISLEEMANEPEDEVRLDSDALALHQTLAKLDDRYRLPIVMFYFHDISYREIAQALDLPLGTLMSRLSRARKLLHQSLDARRRPILLKKANES